MENVIDEMKGFLVKVVFRDGNSIRSIKGKLIDSSSDFIEIQTFSNQFFINRSQIFKIQKVDEGCDSNGKGNNF